MFGIHRIGPSSLLVAALSCTALAGCGDDVPPGEGGGGEGGEGTGAGGESSGGGAVGCLGGSTECGGICVNTDSDNAHCGACDNPCDAGQMCNGSGTCRGSCQPGTTECDGACVNTDTDSAHCGDCATACDPGEVCDGSGTCALSCQVGLVVCDSTCINPDTDEAFCGAGPDCSANPGTVCVAGEVCDGAGACELSCQSGLVDCNGTCIDPDADETYCGAGPDCSVNAGTTCLAGEVCNGAGACELSCQMGLVDCNGTCIDPDTDETYCGAGPDCSVNVGTTCAAGEVCDGTGNCAVTCQEGLTECGGACVDAQTDEAWCGAGLDCVATPGIACGPGEACVLGLCEVSCPAGQIDCNGQCIDPLIDQQHCGAGPDCSVNPGVACGAGDVCVDGSCTYCADPLEEECFGICCAADEVCTEGCEQMIYNGSFELGGGSFDGWSTQDLPLPFFPLSVQPAGVETWPGFFLSTPTDGSFASLSGFDGDGPGEITLGQYAYLQGNVILEFDFRAAWDFNEGGGTLPRDFEIRVEDFGGTVLATFPIFSADPNVAMTQSDTGDLFGQVDLSAFDGQFVFVNFVWIIPEDYSGPGAFQLDNVRASRQ